MMSGHLVRTVSKVQMISATGNRSKVLSSCAGFTLIEIVLVLGLMAVAVAAVIVSFASLADRSNTQTTEEILFSAVRKARFIAANKRTITQLSFDKESNSLQISSDNAESELFPLDEIFKDSSSAAIRFYLVPSSQGLAPPARDAIRTRLETNAVKFAADRSSSPFVAEIDFGSGTPERLVFDPFSSLTLESK